MLTNVDCVCYDEDHTSYEVIGLDTDQIIRESWKDSEGETEDGWPLTGTFTLVCNKMWWIHKWSGLQCGQNFSKTGVIPVVCQWISPHLCNNTEYGMGHVFKE